MTTRRLEPLAILFLYTTATALALGGASNPYGLVFDVTAEVAAVALYVLPWLAGSRLRAYVTGLVAFVMLGQAAFLLSLRLWTIALVWSAVFWGVLLTVTRDQDHSFREKLGVDE